MQILAAFDASFRRQVGAKCGGCRTRRHPFRGGRAQALVAARRRSSPARWPDPALASSTPLCMATGCALPLRSALRAASPRILLAMTGSRGGCSAGSSIGTTSGPAANRSRLNAASRRVTTNSRKAGLPPHSPPGPARARQTRSAIPAFRASCERLDVPECPAWPVVNVQCTPVPLAVAPDMAGCPGHVRLAVQPFPVPEERWSPVECNDRPLGGEGRRARSRASCVQRQCLERPGDRPKPAQRHGPGPWDPLAGSKKVKACKEEVRRHRRSEPASLPASFDARIKADSRAAAKRSHGSGRNSQGKEGGGALGKEGDRQGQIDVRTLPEQGALCPGHNYNSKQPHRQRA